MNGTETAEVFILVNEILGNVLNSSSLLASLSTIDDSESLVEHVLTSTILGMANLPGQHAIIFAYGSTIEKYSDSDFQSHFRLEKATFVLLFDILKDSEHLQYFFPYESTSSEDFDNPGKSVSLKKALLIAIWYLATPVVMRDVGDRFGVAKSTVHKCVRKIVDFLCLLSPKFIAWPQSTQDYNRLESQFEEKAGFPNVVGAVDGCHLKIHAPASQQAAYINRKGTHSVILQAITSPDKLFLDISVGFPGSAHDARVFKNSEFYTGVVLDRNQRFLRDDQHILGDSAYPLLDWVLTPFKDCGTLSASQRRYNMKHSQTRMCVEHTFGLLKARFRTLQLVDASIDYVPKIIMACCVLHNICLMNGDTLEDWYNDQDQDLNDTTTHSNIGTPARNSHRLGEQKRTQIMNRL